jgi:hypothetical protein
MYGIAHWVALLVSCHDLVPSFLWRRGLSGSAGQTGPRTHLPQTATAFLAL